MSISDYQLPYCTITGTFVAVDADSPDEGAFPDVQPLNGTITLTPTTNAGRVDDAFAQILPVTVRVFGGQIVDDEDLPGVRILATDANIGVADWAWRASFNLDGLTLDPLTFKAPRDTTLSLTSGLVPIKSQPYQIIEGASIVDAEVSGEGTMRFKLSDGSYTSWIDVPNGERGLPGVPGEKGEPGADGQAATLAMGAVSAGTVADAWMTGTPLARELNLTLPRGEKGEKGDKGDKGDPGDPATPVSATASATGGTQWDVDLTYTAGALDFNFTFPPMGDGAPLGTTPLDTITAAGLYRQIANAEATLARGYPVAGVGGTLWVEHRSGGIASQVYTPLGLAPYSMYWRSNGRGGQWSAWEGVETTASKAGPDLGTAHLDTITAAGLHRQPANANATLARGYPVEGVGGTLFVQIRSGNVGSQLYTPIGDAPYRMYWRSNWWANTWSEWEGIETSTGKTRGVDESDLLAGYETALGGM